MNPIHKKSFVDLATLAIKVKHISGSAIAVAIQTVWWCVVWPCLLLSEQLALKAPRISVF